MTIMIIEDYPFDEKDLAKMVKTMGYSIVSVNQKESISRIKNLRNYQCLWAIQRSSRDYYLSRTSNEVSPTDFFWLSNVQAFINKHLDDSFLTAESIADEHAMSVRHLSRKLKKLTDYNTTEYVREVRLQKALDCLENGLCTSVKAAGYSVGYHDQKYFSKIFREKFGVTPSELLKKASA